MEDSPQMRQRVSKGRYNQYLKKVDPFEHAPPSSRRCLGQTQKDSEIFAGPTVTFSKDFFTNNIQQSSLPEKEDPSQGLSVTDMAMSSFEEDILIDKEAEIPEQTICQREDINKTIVGEENTKQVLEDNEVTQEKTHLDSEKVFPDSRITVGSFMILLMTFVVKYSLTGEAVTELLQLLDLLCPSENLLVKSLTAFKKWFEHVKHPLIVHYYCSFCQIGLSDINVLAECPNESCRKKLNEASISHFIEIPIAKQIKSFFARPTFKKDIKHRFSREKKSLKSIEDIYDVYIYQKLNKTGGILENENNLSLVCNTDGIPCFRSSNLSLWPLFFQINELQYNKRINPENMILGGLWLGQKKNQQ